MDLGKGGKSIGRIVSYIGNLKHNFPVVHTMGVFVDFFESVFPLFIREGSV